MNLTSLEEWIKENAMAFPSDKASSLLHSLRPVVHLTQFLQVISSIKEMPEFLDTMRSLEGFTLPQAHACMNKYRFEVGEDSFSPEIEDYVSQVVQSMHARSTDHQDLVESQEMNEGDALAVLMDVNYAVPFHIPPLGDRVDVSWDTSSRVPFVPNEVMKMIDPEWRSDDI